MANVCVFCGSRPGVSPNHLAAATAFGAGLAGRGHRLVYGGGRVGLMGALADAATVAGGEVIGVIPRSLLDREIAHHGLTELQVVESLADRKQAMIERSDAFVVLPGGIGTLDELFEVWTQQALGLAHGRLLILDLDGFYGHLSRFLDHVVTQGFLDSSTRGRLHPVATVDELFAVLGDAR